MVGSRLSGPPQSITQCTYSNLRDLWAQYAQDTVSSRLSDPLQSLTQFTAISEISGPQAAPAGGSQYLFMSDWSVFHICSPTCILPCCWHTASHCRFGPIRQMSPSEGVCDPQGSTTAFLFQTLTFSLTFSHFTQVLSY